MNRREFFATFLAPVVGCAGSGNGFSLKRWLENELYPVMRCRANTIGVIPLCITPPDEIAALFRDDFFKAASYKPVNEYDTKRFAAFDRGLPWENRMAEMYDSIPRI